MFSGTIVTCFEAPRIQYMRNFDIRTSNCMSMQAHKYIRWCHIVLRSIKFQYAKIPVSYITVAVSNPWMDVPFLVGY